MISFALHSFLHSEQGFCPFSSHFVIQLVWNTWPQGVVEMSLFDVNTSKHVEHAVFIFNIKKGKRSVCQNSWFAFIWFLIIMLEYFHHMMSLWTFIQWIDSKALICIGISWLKFILSILDLQIFSIIKPNQIQVKVHCKCLQLL